MAPGRGTWYKNSRCCGALSIPVMLYCLMALGILGSTTAELLATPSLRWTFSLDNPSGTGRSLRQGNAVVVSPGGDKLFVTANDGSLHILSVTGTAPITLAVFQPDAVAGTVTECRSSVVPVERTTNAGDVIPYLVYAVIDTPADASLVVGGDILNQTSSRVIAVNMDGTLRWSVTLPGKISGTPAVGSNGQLIYASHNTAINKGSLSVILSTEQGTIAELVASLSPDRDAPLGPPSLQRSLSTGSKGEKEGGAGGGGAGGADGAGGTDSTDRDLVAVAESWGDGFTAVGSIYLLTPSTDFEDTGGRGSNSYQLLLISRSVWSLSAIMAPLFVDTSLWIGGTSGAFGGWTDSQDVSNVIQGSEQDVQPRWVFQYEMNALNASQPFAVTPEISMDGSELYLPGTTTGFYCLQSSSGQILWTTTVESVVLNRPVAFSSSSGANVLYFIESFDGRVRQISTSDASDIWQFNCVNAFGIESCQDSVEAEFSVSPSGNVIYYGDVFGRINSLQVATFTTVAPTGIPSAAPSIAPSALPSSSSSPTIIAVPVPAATTSPTVGQTALRTMLPTTSPTLYTGNILGPSVFNTPESALAASNGSNEDSENLSVGLIVGVAIAGLVVISLAAFFVARILVQPQKRSRKRSTNTNNETHVVVNDFDGDIEADFESSGDDDASDSMDEDDLDDVTVTSASDGVEVEVAASHLYSTPVKKTRSRKKRRKLRTPPTTTTLASIQEAEDEELAALPAEDYPKIDLNDKFRATETETPVLERVADDVDTNMAPMHHFRPLADDMSQGSDDDDDDEAPRPPPGRETPQFDKQNYIQDPEEEKKDGEFDCQDVGTLSPQPSFGMTGDSPAPLSPAHSTGSMKSLMASFVASLTRSPGNSDASRTLSPAASAASPASLLSARSPGDSEALRALSPDAPPTSLRSVDSNMTPTGRMSPGVLSTDSSLYTDDQSRLSTDRLSPLSTGIFGGNDQVSLPDDEAVGLAHPSLSHSFSSRDEAVLGIGRAPGAHYLAVRPKFKPTGTIQVPKVKSVRTKRNLNGFSGSYLQSENTSGDENDDDEARIRSKASAMIDSKKAPTFKRRSKRDEAAPRSSNVIEDTWNSFLDDLAAAEQQFFSPTHSQKSAVLRYNKDDDETTLSAPIDDDATIRTGTI